MFEAALDISAELIVEWTRLRQRCSPARATAARGRRRRACTRPTTPERLAGGVGRDRRAVAGAGRRARAARPGRPIPRWRPRRPARRSTTGSTRRSAPGRADARPRQGGRPARSPPGCPRRPRSTPAAPRGTRSSSPAGYYEQLDHPVIGALPHPVAAVPLRRASTGGSGTPAPMLGQHNHEMLTDCSASPTTRSPRSRPTASSADRPLGTLTMRSTMATDLFDRFAVIDVDTHLTEPPDVWTARVPAALHDAVPAHRAASTASDVWVADGERIGAPGYYSMAGFDGVHAGVDARRPTTRSPPSMYDAARPAARSSTSRASTPRCSTRTSAGSGTATSCASATASSSPRACGPTTTSCTDWCSADPDRLRRRSPRCRSGTSTLAVAEMQRCIGQRPPGGQLLQPAAGLRPAAARPPALGPDLGRRAGGRRAGELPRRRRVDGHAVRRHRRAWAG